MPTDGLTLAERMQAWEAAQRIADEAQAEADLIAEGIKAEVLALGKTQVVGNVRATWKAGRKTYDYQAAAQQLASIEIIEAHTVPQTDWRKVCETAQIKPDIIPFTQSEPSVTVKLEDSSGAAGAPAGR